MMKKILIIDDDLDRLRCFQVALENQGFTILTAENGEIAFKMLQNEMPDLVVLDVMMETNLEGYKLLHKIKKEEKYRELPVIILSGLSDQPEEDKYSGFYDEKIFPNVHFQNKAVDPIRLGIMIHKMLEPA